MRKKDLMDNESKKILNDIVKSLEDFKQKKDDDAAEISRCELNDYSYKCHEAITKNAEAQGKLMLQISSGVLGGAFALSQLFESNSINSYTSVGIYLFISSIMLTIISYSFGQRCSYILMDSPYASKNKFQNKDLIASLKERMKDYCKENKGFWEKLHQFWNSYFFWSISRTMLDIIAIVTFSIALASTSIGLIKQFNVKNNQGEVIMTKKPSPPVPSSNDLKKSFPAPPPPKIPQPKPEQKPAKENK